MKKQRNRRWYTMTELRHLTDEELVEMAISLGGSEEWRNDKDRGDVLAFIMGKQICLRNEGYEFEKGGEK